MHDVRFDFDAPASELEIELVVSLAISMNFYAAVQVFIHMLEGTLVHNDVSAAWGDPFGVERVEKGWAHCHRLVAREHPTNIQDATVAICNAQL